MQTYTLKISTTEANINQPPIYQSQLRIDFYLDYLAAFDHIESYEDLLEFLLNFEWNKAYSNLLLQRIIPIEIELKETDSTKGGCESKSKKFWPPVTTTFVIVLKDKWDRVSEYEFDCISDSKGEDILKPEDVYGIIKGEKTFHLIKSPNQKHLFEDLHGNLQASFNPVFNGIYQMMLNLK